ncbi:UTP--glucose-1-phosphate uridylyltransferase 3, chloroplastic [Stylosanthes scabra]|uniref:UTP--glucose-1-phosphate uridylyltransferase 3, chloroplastic n=1 Tax=Stylosanthes scabra TaxID=79078 RepID=A0ABU6WJL8_9FABA|nr:UTP--glucose-1-phosphate uridylyltransferase 3, chloroplastic [Stylosanthes scabra]
MVHSTSTSTSLLHNNNRFLFSFNSSSISSNSHSNSLSFTRSLSPSPSPSSSSSSVSSSSSLCCRVARVSTEHLELSPPPPGFNFRREIARLSALRDGLAACATLHDKLRLLDADARVRRFFSSDRSRVLESLRLTSGELFLLKCLVAAGQEHVLCSGEDGVEAAAAATANTSSSVKTALYALAEMIESLDPHGSNGGSAGFRRSTAVTLNDEEIRNLESLLESLGEIERFYDCIGGILGYQIKTLEILVEKSFERHNVSWSQHMHEMQQCQVCGIDAPKGLDLTENTDYASQAALWGIEGLPDLGEIYPLGGSADRLGLVDSNTGECLPAAMLPYCGRTLLEGLIRDLQAREFLYFKLYGKQCITPVAIMTSSAKNNHEHVTSLCERLSWFGRGRSTFQFFEQPLVPVVGAEDGQWLATKQFIPLSKPGGHGVIWKLAHDKGIFKWFSCHGRKGATLRQVSNVVAATDLTLLALAGIGLRQGKKMGFASCKRNSGATEGINVLMEKKNLDGNWEYGVSCIEYTEFDKFGITDGPRTPDCLQADFPANTNILYIDLPSAELVGSSKNENCLPGMVLNTKKPMVYVDQFGRHRSVLGGRLECTMQNIADNFSNVYQSRCYNGVEDKLDTFIVCNERRRVTSSAKKKRRHGDKSLHQFDLKFAGDTGVVLNYAVILSLRNILRNAHDLLSQCDIRLPEIEANGNYVNLEPPFLILLHPALGPLWEVTRQKFYGGSIAKGSELQIELAEFFWKNVQLNGSLIAIAENAMGSMKINENGESILHYGQRCGRCKLENVKILNKGIDWTCGENIYWKHDVQRSEVFKIILHGNAEFEATDVVLQGNHVYEVPDGYKMKISQGNSGLAIQLDPIEESRMESGSWHWNYKIEGSHVRLELVES